MSRQAKSERTKARLSEAMESLLLEKPLPKIKVKEITDIAGVDRQTFYYHFDTIEDLVEFSCRRWFDKLVANINPNDGIHEVLSQILSRVESQKEHLRTLQSGVGRSVIKEFTYNDIKQAVVSFFEHTTEGFSINAGRKQFAEEHCVLAIGSVLDAWVKGEIDHTREELAHLLGESFTWYINGLIEGKDKKMAL